MKESQLPEASIEALMVGGGAMKCRASIAKGSILAAILLILGSCDFHTNPAPFNTYRCNCSCNVKAGGFSASYPVCMPPSLNANLGGNPPTQADLQNDCSMRVQDNLSAMAMQCESATLACTCNAASGKGSQFYDASCDQPCTEADLTPNCSNWNPFANPPVKTATNYPGMTPVCLVANSDPADPVAFPFASELFGRESECDVSGSITASQNGGGSQTQSADGVVKITGGPCPGGSCDVGVSYQTNHIDNFSFSSFLGFDTVVLQNPFASGASIPAGATLDATGNGSFAANTTQNLGLARRSNQLAGVEVSSQQAIFTGANDNPLAISVDWQNHSCAMSGAVDEQIGGADFAVTTDLGGTIVNEPPTANAGGSQTVQCTSPAGASIRLDGSHSSDPENNIVIYSWRQGTRSGPELGDDATLQVSEGLGVSQNYVLKVIDAFGQASEDSASVSVVDTVPPIINKVSASPTVLWPPNLKLVTINVSVSDSDTCDPNPVCKLTNITANEPIAPQDAQITGSLTASLSAARLGSGSGRLYTLTVQCTDASGNAATATTTVAVPHDRST